MESRPSSGRPIGIAVLLVGLLLSGGCGGNQSGNQTQAPATPTGTGSGADDTATYGYGPQPAPGVTYQPDVVMVQGAAASIRSASSDGFVWTIDRSAPGAADLAVDKVMLLTSRATGRVIAIRDDGPDRVVTLAPVTLGEIVADGTFSLDQQIDLDAMGYQEIPELPAQLVIPGSSPDASPEVSPSSVSAPVGELVASAGGWDVQVPALRLRASANAPDAGDLPPALKPRQCIEVTVGAWSAKPCAEKGRVSLGIDYKAGGGGKPGLKVGVVISLPSAGLRLRTNGSISDGQMNGTTAVVEGLSGVDVEVAGGSVGGLGDNDKVKVEVPIEIDAPIPPSPTTLGLPLNIKFEFKYIVETAFSSKNSTLTATGNYELNGPLGIESGNLVTPAVTVKQDLIDSLNGIGFGATGFVFVAKVKVQAGLGVPAATAGPYVAVTTTVGLTLGSSLGIVQCKLTNWDLKAGAGFGINITQDAVKSILEKLALPKSKLKSETEKSWSIFHADMVKPNVLACRP